MLERKSIQVVGAIFVQNNTVFAALRGSSKYAYIANRYEFPGGKIEKGELPHEALERELREEMQLDVVVGSHYMTVRYAYPDFDITLQVYLCEMKTDFHLCEHIGFRWFPAEELQSEMWAPADAPIVEQLKMDLINKRWNI